MSNSIKQTIHQLESYIRHVLSIFYFLFVGIIILMMSCETTSKPSKSIIESEFKHAWYSLHGEHGEKGYGWELISLQIGKIKIEPKTNIAKVTITYTYKANGGITVKTGKFIFIKLNGEWQIEDRDARNPDSSTRYQMTP